MFHYTGGTGGNAVIDNYNTGFISTIESAAGIVPSKKSGAYYNNTSPLFILGAG